jgi:hypothetical protein
MCFEIISSAVWACTVARPRMRNTIENTKRRVFM